MLERKPHIPFQEKDDGCFIMYRSDKFRIISNVSQGLFVPDEQYLNKPNCAQIVLFECRSTFCGSPHFLILYYLVLINSNNIFISIGFIVSN